MIGRCIIGLLLGAVGILALSVSVAQSQVGGGYDLSWSTVDGGGVTSSTGGTYSLGGTMGQSNAGIYAGGSYTMTIGFWAAFRNERLSAHQHSQLGGHDWPPRADVDTGMNHRQTLVDPLVQP